MDRIDWIALLGRCVVEKRGAALKSALRWVKLDALECSMRKKALGVEAWKLNPVVVALEAGNLKALRILLASKPAPLLVKSFEAAACEGGSVYGWVGQTRNAREGIEALEAFFAENPGVVSGHRLDKERSRCAKGLMSRCATMKSMSEYLRQAVDKKGMEDIFGAFAALPLGKGCMAELEPVQSSSARLVAGAGPCAELSLLDEALVFKCSFAGEFFEALSPAGSGVFGEYLGDPSARDRVLDLFGGFMGNRQAFPHFKEVFEEALEAARGNPGLAEFRQRLVLNYLERSVKSYKSDADASIFHWLASGEISRWVGQEEMGRVIRELKDNPMKKEGLLQSVFDAVSLGMETEKVSAAAKSSLRM